MAASFKRTLLIFNLLVVFGISSSENTCIFPFYDLDGNSYDECYSTEQEQYAICPTSINITSRQGLEWMYCPDTSNCKFPFEYENEEHDECIPDSTGYLWCQVKEIVNGNNWDYCYQKSTKFQALTVNAQDSQPCVFPYKYYGVQYEDCMTDNENVKWCPIEVDPSSLEGIAWKLCPNREPCVFPFKYLNNEYNECTIDGDPDDKLWCATSVNSETKEVSNWKHCENN